MSDVLCTMMWAHNYQWTESTRAIVYFTRAQIQVLFVILCWGMFLLTMENYALPIYLSCLATVQLFWTLWPFTRKWFNIGVVPMLAGFGSDFLLTAIGLNWILLTNATRTLPWAYTVYGTWALFSWFYTILAHHLFMSLLFALLFLSYNGGDDDGGETSSQDGANSEDLENTVVRNFISSALSSVAAAVPVSTPSSHDQCTICLAEYEAGEEIRDLPCNHAYHRECIDEWLRAHRRCPICRTRPSEFVPTAPVVPVISAPPLVVPRPITIQEDAVETVNNVNDRGKRKRQQRKQQRKQQRRRSRGTTNE